MKRKTIWLLIILFTALSSLPFLVPGCAILSLFAFIPLFALADGCSDNHIKHANWLYFSAFFLFNAVTTFWICWISPIGAIAAISINALQMFFIFWLFVKSKKRLKGALPYLLFISAWLVWERIYQMVEISWPWLVLGESFATSPKLAQWFEYTGPLGGSLLILLTAAVIYNIYKTKGRGRIALIGFAAILLVVPPIVSLAIYSNYQEVGEAREVVAVQPNIDAYTEKHGGLDQNLQDEKLLSLAKPLISDNTCYVITPETFGYNLDLDNPTSNSTYCNIESFIEQHPQIDFLLGSLTYRIFTSKAKASVAANPLQDDYWYDMYNTALMIGPKGIINFYHKSKLVPGVEIIPYQQYVPFLGKLISKFGGSTSSYARQKELSVLEDRYQNKVGAMICYESIYSEYYRKTALFGADFVAVITNDGWWGDTPGYHQHFRFARLRAIETRRDVVHVANTGISGFINQRGDVMQRTGWWEPVAIKDNIHANDALTFYVVNGDIIGRVACFLFFMLCAAWIVNAVKPS